MRNLILALAASVFASGLTLLMLVPQTGGTPARPTSLPPLTVERVRELGTLVTTRVTVRDEYAESTSGYLGSLTVRWQGDGSVLLGPDLSGAEIVGRNDANRTATVVVPEPTVLERTLDLSTGRVDVELDGLWQAAPDARLLAAGQQRVLDKVRTRLADGVTAEHRAASRRSAEAMLRRLGCSLGWTLRVQWQVKPDRSSRPS